MCLRTTTPYPLVAEHDITCYKVLVSTPRCYYTPFMAMAVSIPCTISANDMGLPLYEPDVNSYVVECEGVHAFTDIWSARSCANSGPAVVVECTIPAGTEYWDGMDGDIAARKMIIEKIID